MGRVEPLRADRWPPAMLEAMDGMTPPNPHFALNADPDRPRAMNILGSMAHHPALARAFLTLNGHLLLATTLSERQRELAILRVADVCRADYEWAQHRHLAHDAGIGDDEIEAVRTGPGAPNWSALDAAILRAVDELLIYAELGEGTWSELSQSLDVQQILDLIFTVGAYTTLAWMLRTLRVPLDPDLR